MKVASLMVLSLRGSSCEETFVPFIFSISKRKEEEKEEKEEEEERSYPVKERKRICRIRASKG